MTRLKESIRKYLFPLAAAIARVYRTEVSLEEYLALYHGRIRKVRVQKHAAKWGGVWKRDFSYGGGNQNHSSA